jgi:hypothetical protein
MDRAALARKYRVLAALRAGASVRPALAALSAEFPGALRELDELPLAEIELRIAELEGEDPLRAELLAIGHFHDHVLAARARPATRRAGRRPSREALALVARELDVAVAEAHRLVFPFAHVRRDL